MSDFRKELKKAEEIAVQWEEQINASFSNLGQLLFDADKGDNSFAEPIAELKNQLIEKENQKKKLEKIVEELAVLKDKNKKQKELREELEKEKGELFSRIGQESYELHKQKAWEEPSFNPVFEKLTQLDDKIQEAENDLYRLRSNVSSGNLWNKLNSAFKAKAKQSTKKNAGDSMEKQYRKVAEMLFAFNSFEPLLKEHLPRIYSEFQNLSGLLEKNEKDLEAIDLKKKTLRHDAGEEAKNLTKSIAILSETIDELEDDLDILFINLGEDYWANKKIPAQWENEIEGHQELLDSRDNTQILIDKIQHQISREQLLADKKSWEKKRENKESQLLKLNQEMEQILAELEEIDQKIKEEDKGIASLEIVEDRKE